MSTRHLERLLAPRSVAVVGASDRANSVGATVMRNLLAGGFAGAIWPVNPRHARVAGQRAYAEVAALPEAPDLAVVCTPAPAVPGVIAALGARGTRAAVVLTAGLETDPQGHGRSLQQQMLDAARPHCLRVLGPNCVGLLVPGIGLNASFSHMGAQPGPLAFISQSGALVTGVLDWAASQGVGFSHFISVGASSDVDFGDLLDHLGSDPGTRAILLYIESIRSPRKFMSAARAAARNKPVLVVKSGRAPEAARAAASHTGALAGADDVFDAAIRRAGMLRVDTMAELFVAAEWLARAPRFTGDRLLIVTNGGGAGVLAADAAVRGGARLAELGDETLARLDAVLPATWSRGNPVDIIGDAPVRRYVQALEVATGAPQTDAVLFIHAPSAIVPAADIAAAVVPVIQAGPLPTLSCWLGARGMDEARRIVAGAGIASFATPEEAVQAFVQAVTYRRNQDQLLEVPGTDLGLAAPDLDAARAVLAPAREQGRAMLHEAEAKQLLGAFGIPVVRTEQVASVDEALAAAESIGFPVALKILSRDISHKSDVGGVVLDLESPEALRQAATGMLRRVRRAMPEARLDGFTVQEMIRRPHARELIVGVASDALFGPVILFGHGGKAVEQIGDRAVALAPLNEPLARELVARTRVARLLAAHRDLPASDLAGIHRVLVRVSRMVVALPDLLELDINPLLADADGVVALDARVRIDPNVALTDRFDTSRLAIRPYPAELERRLQWNGGLLLIRPIRPEDAQHHLEFLERVDPEDIRMRVFVARRSIAKSELARLTQIDYEREMAFVAIVEGADGQRQTIGAARAVTDPDNQSAEFGILVQSDLKGRGLGRLLLSALIEYCRGRGTRHLVGDVLRENAGMLSLGDALGFEAEPSELQGCVRLKLDLSGPMAAASVEAATAAPAPA